MEIFKKIIYSILMFVVSVLFFPMVIASIIFVEVLKPRIKSDIDAFLSAIFMISVIILTQYMWFGFIYKLYLGAYSMYY